tara:strand:- start:88 stop:483 length:396 start_codon:yes stop_codon:yes gene_type:complete
MKSEEFQKILKPLIEKTVREVLLQEGVLSQVVSEVAKGLNNNLVESKQNNASNQTRIDKEQEELYQKQKAERIKKLNESSGFANVFEGTQVVQESSGHGALSGISPTDKGVDISAIQKLSKGRWKALAGGK